MLDPRQHQRPRAFALLVLLLVVAAGLGCEARAGEPRQDRPARGWADQLLVREDTAHGVVCYELLNVYASARAPLSCVKVRP